MTPMPFWLVTALPPPSSQTEAAPLWLAGCALQITPRVALLEKTAWGLEVSTVLRLWGGIQGVLARLRDEVLAAGSTQNRGAAEMPEVAWAPTSLGALGRWRAGQRWRCDVLPSTTVPMPSFSALDGLPLHTLTAAQPHVATMGRMGLHSWGQLSRLPRAGVARRWGDSVLVALDQALGLLPETHRWQAPTLGFERKLELPWAFDSALALLPHAEKLLSALGRWLDRHQLGVLAWAWGWQYDTRRHAPEDGGCVLRTASPTQDLEHVLRLTREHWAQLRLAAPVVGLRLQVLAHAPWQPEEKKVWDLAAPTTRQTLPWEQLLERLSARLGPEAVTLWRGQDEHIPECMQAPTGIENGASTAFLERTSSPKRDANGKSSMGVAPTWLLAQPLPLSTQGGRPVYLGALRLVLGPHRLELTQWPGGPQVLDPVSQAEPQAVVRDYFVAHSPRAGWVWVYRASPGARWFLHGVFA